MPATVHQLVMSLPLPAPSVVCTPLPDGAVLFDVRTEQYFGLNHVGARVWALLEPQRVLDALCTAIGIEYPDAPPQELRADIEALLGALVADGLAIPATPHATLQPPDAAPPAPAR